MRKIPHPQLPKFFTTHPPLSIAAHFANLLSPTPHIAEVL